MLRLTSAPAYPVSNRNTGSSLAVTASRSTFHHLVPWKASRSTSSICQRAGRRQAQEDAEELLRDLFRRLTADDTIDVASVFEVCTPDVCCCGTSRLAVVGDGVTADTANILRGARRCSAVLGAAWQCSAVWGGSAMLRGARRCSAPLGGAPRCLAVLRGARQCSAVLGAALRCSAVLGGARRRTAVLSGARRCTAVLGGV